MNERLQKVLARGGCGSRRACEQLITEGRVEVDGQIVIELGTTVDADKQQIKVDGDRIKVKNNKVVVAVNKPKGYVSTMSDPEGRYTLQDLVGEKYGRLFHIGRLDADSEGLILMTNDGDFAQKLSHPSSNIQKIYIATVSGEVTRQTVRKLLSGVELSDGLEHFDELEVLRVGNARNLSGKLVSICQINIHSGKNRVIRRMFKAVGHKVEALERVQIGNIKIGELKTGHSRVLSPTEISSF